MTQPDNPRHAPINDHRQILINAAPYDQFMGASLLPRDWNIAGIACGCYTRGTKSRSVCVDRNWLKRYPPGVPADIDPDSYASLRDIFEEACATHRHSP